MASASRLADRLGRPETPADGDRFTGELARLAVTDLAGDELLRPERAGVTPPPGSLAHALRRTYATLPVDAGASLPECSGSLGMPACLRHRCI